MQTSKVMALEKVFQGIEKQLVSFENTCREGIKMDVTAVKKKWDSSIELLTQFMKRPRLELIEEDDKQCIPNEVLHREENKWTDMHSDNTPDPPDDGEIQKEADEDDERKGAPTAEELDAYKQLEEDEGEQLNFFIEVKRRCNRRF